MNVFLAKIKVPFFVVALSVLIILFSLVITAVVNGNADNVYIPEETVSEIGETSSSPYEILSVDESVLPLPEISVKSYSALTTYESKTLTEKLLTYESGNIRIKIFKYAYLVEDEMQKMPKNAEMFEWNGIDVFVFENKNGTASAVYRKGLISCTVTAEGSLESLSSLFDV